ncbi:MAG: hypothetical protein BEN18_10260 [Epulopiscium sp. Nuni2H_MBin001]|nr:MAG: hypothetical protein BEN18_10260 [Epulopiscium sp. Nuni2H_MBin001]
MPDHNMQIIKIDSTGHQVDITSIIGGLTISGDYRCCTRRLDFYIIKHIEDLSTFVIAVNLGEHIKVIVDGEIIFYGVVWDRTKVTNTAKINVYCTDFGIYLTKNFVSYKFKDLTPDVITTKICSDFGINIGNLITTGNPISRIFINQNLADIIISSYNLSSTADKFMIIFTNNQLNVIKKGSTEVRAPLSGGVNLYTAEASESLDGMINAVNVYNANDNLVTTIINDFEYNHFGSLSEYLKYKDDEDYETLAKSLLQGITHKITVENVGDISYVTGKKITVKEDYTGLNGIFYIDEDYHTFRNGTYTNKLVLNYHNIADDKTAGSEETADD